MKPKNESVLPKPKTNWLFLLLVATVAFFAYSYVAKAAVEVSLGVDGTTEVSSVDLGVPTKLEGNLVTEHFDNFEAKSSYDRYILRTADGKRYTIVFLGASYGAVSAKNIVLPGSLKGSVLTVKQGDIPVETKTLLGKASSPILGVHKVAVILFNFSNNRNEPENPEVVRALVFGNTGASVKNYYKEASGTQTNIASLVRTDGDIFGYYQMPFVGTGCDIDQWEPQLEAKARAEGVRLDEYDNVIYGFPYVYECGWRGAATIGSTRVWINDYFNIYGIAHELGHDLGAHHANGYRCYDANHNPVVISSNCVSIEYGDPFDIMGNYNNHHPSTFHKWQLGWYQRPSDTATVTQTGDYTLISTEAYNPGLKAIRIPRTFRSDGTPLTYLYLEYRRPYGRFFDNFNSTDRVVNGVSVRLGPDLDTQTQSSLIDATPETADFIDSAFTTGQTFFDPISGQSIGIVSLTNDEAHIHIGSECGHQTPVVTWNPDVLPQAVPGGVAHIALLIWNRDSALCPASTFSISIPTKPADWVMTNPEETVSIAPGLSGPLTALISIPSSTPEGSYDLTYRVTHGAYPAHYVETSGWIRVDPTAPTFSVNTSISVPRNGVVMRNQSVNIWGTFQDDESEMYSAFISLDNVTSTPCSENTYGNSYCHLNFAAGVLPAGPHNFHFVGTNLNGQQTVADWPFIQSALTVEQDGIQKPTLSVPKRTPVNITN